MQSGAVPAGKIKENPAGQQCSGQGIHDDVGGQSSVPPQSCSILPLLGENQAPGVILVILQSSWSNLYQQNKVQFDEVHLLWPKYFTGKFPFCLPSLSFLQLCERTDTSPPPPPLPPEDSTCCVLVTLCKAEPQPRLLTNPSGVNPPFLSRWVVPMVSTSPLKPTCSTTVK